MSDVVKAALAAAYGETPARSDITPQEFAHAIAAFLEALPPHQMRLILGRDSYSPDATTTRKLATAVRRAAEREGT